LLFCCFFTRIGMVTLHHYFNISTQHQFSPPIFNSSHWLVCIKHSAMQNKMFDL
jgi:hypothetical protein